MIEFVNLGSRSSVFAAARFRCGFLKDIWGLCPSCLAASDGVYVEVSGSLLASYISDDRFTNERSFFS